MALKKQKGTNKPSEKSKKSGKKLRPKKKLERFQTLRSLH